MILVNNRDRIEWEEGMTIADLLAQLRYSFPHIIVSINGEVITKDFATHPIPDGADVRVIHLIAGG
ncbi:MAG: sulfur carrier protein ThiS [Anaerolineae bacterium]|nr:sulfur carrier protein ThiS [Anaerolineae bacterium]